MKHRKRMAILLICSAAPLATAADLVSTRDIGMELARDLASAAVIACRKKGFQISAVVVDRHAQPRAELRDDLASRFTLQIAREKANAVIMAGVDSGRFVKNRQEIRAELNHVDGIIMLRGGLPIHAAGTRVGAIGVSGAPGGAQDESCAKAALEQYVERLEFAD